jgi:two-component system chemotaxis response regulator CheY
MSADTEKTVLVIDDSRTFRVMVTFAIKKFTRFNKPVEAADGLEALEAMAKNDIELVICDINMPNMDGLEFVKTIRADDNYKDIPVIMLTTEGADESRQKAMDVGASSYLQKPFKPNELTDEMKKFTNI